MNGYSCRKFSCILPREMRLWKSEFHCLGVINVKVRWPYWGCLDYNHAPLPLPFTLYTNEINDWCFRPRFCTVEAILGLRQPGRMRWSLLCIMPLAQHRSLDLLASSSERYHCTTDTPPPPPSFTWYVICPIHLPWFHTPLQAWVLLEDWCYYS